MARSEEQWKALVRDAARRRDRDRREKMAPRMSPEWALVIFYLALVAVMSAGFVIHTLFGR